MKARTPEQVLEHLRQLKEKLTPNLQKKVGNVFFGDDLRLAKLQGAKIPKGSDTAEINTAWENNLEHMLQTWVDRSSDEAANYFKKNKALLDQLAKEFPELLRPPIGQTAYRGTSIKKSSLESAFKKKKFKVINIKGREVFHFKNLDYTPNRSAQSWTTDPKVAFKFEGVSDVESTHIAVVYVCKVNKDFIFNPVLLNTIFITPENETVRVAKKGTFEAFVDTGAIINTWDLDLRDYFVHKLPSAKPYFDKMVVEFNRLVKADNKRMGEDLLSPAGSVDHIITYFYEDSEGKIPAEFNVHRVYNKYAKKYVNAIKKK